MQSIFDIRNPDRSRKYWTRVDGSERYAVNGEKALFDNNVIIYLSKRELPLAFIEKFNDIRRNHTIKLPDAIIAATADCENLTLVTRNTNDFKKLGLALIDPFL